MRVIATAGHVDHGKSTLVRALTGTDPDRLDEEKRRGLTIDLGFAGVDLPNGEVVAFVDVPGHRRFIGNMLAGLGPAPVVMFVVAADQGWQAQSSEHLDAVDALGLRQGLLVLTRCGLASPQRVAQVRADAGQAIARTSLGDVTTVETDAVHGGGVDELRSALAELVDRLPPIVDDSAVRLWVDRAFSVKGAGTVVTGTLAQGTVRVGERLLAGPHVSTVRSLEVLGESRTTVGPVSRVALGLRGVSREHVPRGTALETPSAFLRAGVADVRRETGRPWAEASSDVTVHLGTAAVAARVRPLDDDHARLTLAAPLPLLLGDRLIVRDDSAGRIHCGATVLDVSPAPFTRRGAARERAERLRGWVAARAGDIVADRGVVPVDWLVRAGASGHEAWPTAAALAPGDAALAVARASRRHQGAECAGDESDDEELDRERFEIVHGLAVSGAQLAAWKEALATMADADADDPLSAGMPTTVARERLGIPGEIVLHVARAAGLAVADGRLRGPRHASGLGEAETAVTELRQRLQENAFDAPEADELAGLGLGDRVIATAAQRGLLLRLPAQPADIVLLPDAPARAMRVLAGLAQPFTTSEARQALGTTRRVVIPLLEHLDARGWTRREGNARSVAR